VLAVGLGAGITLRGIMDLSPDHADVVELSRGVVEAAARFAPENGRVLDDPRVRTIIQDGRNYLTTSDQHYDVIVLDILHPMSAGASTVFSREYYELCREHLTPAAAGAPGGLVCQWLPVHQLSEDSVRTVLRTFRSVFPHTTVWYGLIGDSTQVIGLVGSRDPLATDDAALAAGYMRAGEPLQRSLQEVNLGSLPLFLSHFVLGEAAAADFAGAGPLDTDDRPRIEFEAPRLAATAARQGKLNLLALAARTDTLDALFPHNVPAAIDVSAVERYRTGKRTIIEAMRFDLRNEPDARAAWFRTAIERDPGNPDLLELAPRSQP
jgi:spermidine synthase